MDYPVLVNKKVCLKEFIDFWSSLYSDPHQDLYENTIENKRFKGDDIFKLYEWKNGGPLSERKKTSVKRIVEKLDFVNQLKRRMDPEAFEKSFGKMAAIWKIFLYHIIAPEKYPIFDQHVYRAYHYIKHGTVNEIVDNDKMKIAVYVDYVIFFQDMLKQGANPRKLDKALWSFGKFLKTPTRIIL